MHFGACTNCGGKGYADMLGMEHGQRVLIRVPCGICCADGVVPLATPEAYRNVTLTPTAPGSAAKAFPVDRIAGISLAAAQRRIRR
jgi:hypothetical protein